MIDPTPTTQLTFTGDTVSVLTAFPQGVVATPGGTPTPAFEDLLTGLLITQANLAAQLAGDTATAATAAMAADAANAECREKKEPERDSHSPSGPPHAPHRGSRLAPR